MHEILALMGLTRHNVLRDTDAALWVKRWLHYSRCGMSLWSCIGFDGYCPFRRCYENVENNKDMSTFVRHLDEQPFPEIGPLLVILRRLRSHLYFAEYFDYGGRDCDFEG